MALTELNGTKPGLDKVVQLAHRHLRLDVAYIGEFTGGRHICRSVVGDAARFRLVVGEGPPSLATYCDRLVRGEIPNLIVDTRADPRVSDLPVTRQRQIGAYIAAPLSLPDGTVYGTLCCLNRVPDPTLDERDVRFLAMLAEMLAPDIEDRRRLDRLQEELATLVESGDFAVAYQPVVEIATRRCLGVEALARFPRPFPPLVQTFSGAYEVGLGLELERLVVRRAWPTMEGLGDDQFLTVNLSPTAVLALARRALGREDVCFSKLVVEITEQSVVDSYDELREGLAPHRERGLRIAIDDAGAGYASLRHIIELQPDFIKIDQSLINGLADQRNRRVAVSAIVLLAMDLGATLIAEGVERQEDLDAVAELGVPAAQGYLLGGPSTDPRALAGWTGQPGLSVSTPMPYCELLTPAVAAGALHT